MIKDVKYAKIGANYISIYNEDDIMKASTSGDCITWIPLDYLSSIVQNNLDYFMSNDEAKFKFFNDHIGHKILIEGKSKGWLHIKSIEEIGFKPIHESNIYRIAYDNIIFDKLPNGKLNIVCNYMPAEIKSEEIEKIIYDSNLKSSVRDGKSIIPMNIRK